MIDLHLKAGKASYIFSLWAPVLAQMALIFYFSAQPGGSAVLESFPLPAGLGHLGGYGLLGLFLYRAFNRGLWGWSFQAAKSSMLVAVFYAISDELHQLFVPGRHAALTDVFIDAAGALLALAAIRLLQPAGTGKQKGGKRLNK